MDALIIWLMLVIILSTSSFSLLAPFYPGMAKTEKGVTSGTIGMIMGSFSLTQIITAVLVGRFLTSIGRRNSEYIGLLILTISSIGFGCLIWVNDKTLFILLSFGFRMLGGVANGFILVSAYAMTQIKYKEDVQAKISLLQAAAGIGLFMGPVFGGLIYQLTTFWMPFFLFAVLSLLVIPFLRRALDPELDRDDSKNETGEKLGFCTLLSHKRVIFASFAQFFNMIMFTAGAPIFGPRLATTYGLSNILVGACFALPNIFFILSGIVLMPLLTKAFEKRSTMIVGFFALAGAFYLVGPSNLFGLPSKSIGLMIIGLCIIGTGAAFTIIPVIPEMRDAVEGQYPGQESQVSDKFSAIFSIAGGLGQATGPVLSGLLDDKIGFNWTMDIIGSVILLFNIIYLLICGGIPSLARSFKATALRWRRGASVEATTADSPKRHLLLEEPDLDETADHSGLIHDATHNKMTKEYDSEDAIDISTDTNLAHDNSQTIN